jgi:hypothetical protein
MQPRSRGARPGVEDALFHVTKRALLVGVGGGRGVERLRRLPSERLGLRLRAAAALYTREALQRICHDRRRIPSVCSLLCLARRHPPVCVVKGRLRRRHAAEVRGQGIKAKDAVLNRRDARRRRRHHAV